MSTLSPVETPLSASVSSPPSPLFYMSVDVLVCLGQSPIIQEPGFCIAILTGISKQASPLSLLKLLRITLVGLRPRLLRRIGKTCALCMMNSILSSSKNNLFYICLVVGTCGFGFPLLLVMLLCIIAILVRVWLKIVK